MIHILFDISNLLFFLVLLRCSILTLCFCCLFYYFEKQHFMFLIFNVICGFIFLEVACFIPAFVNKRLTKALEV